MRVERSDVTAFSGTVQPCSLLAAQPSVTSPGEGWEEAAVERSIKTAKLGGQRVQRFLHGAIIIEKAARTSLSRRSWTGSRQSLRSFYLQFDGKHELLLALFEDALSRSADQMLLADRLSASSNSASNNSCLPSNCR